MWTAEKESYVLSIRTREDGQSRYSIFRRGEVPGAVIIEDDDLATLIIRHMLDAGVPTIGSFQEGVNRGYFKHL